MMRAVQILESFEQLEEALGQGTERLHPQTDAEVFCTQAWFENLARNGLTPTQGGQCLFLLGRDPQSGHAACLPLRQGRHLEALANYYSSLYGPIAWSAGAESRPGETRQFADWLSMCRHLRTHPARWPVIRLDPLDTETPFYKGIMAALRSTGYWVDSFFCFGNWYLTVDQRPFDTYFQSLPSPLRNNIRRGQSRLTRAGSWNITIHQHQGADLDMAVAAFIQIYNQSWKGPEPNASFIPGLARMAAQNGWLRLGVLSLDSKPIAAQIWLVKSGKAAIFKLAYVSGYERFSAGTILTAALMRHVIDRDLVREVDYLTGDDAYKRDWMSHRRERRGLVAFDPATIAGLWAAARHFVGKWAKRGKLNRG